MIQYFKNEEDVTIQVDLSTVTRVLEDGASKTAGLLIFEIADLVNLKVKISPKTAKKILKEAGWQGVWVVVNPTEHLPLPVQEVPGEGAPPPGDDDEPGPTGSELRGVPDP